ncbi:MAG: hypothetical protein ACK5IQ_01575 [Bacteroidales bacterium]
MNEILATEIECTGKVHLIIDISILENRDLKKEVIYCFFKEENEFKEINFSNVESLFLNNRSQKDYSRANYSGLFKLFPNVSKLGIVNVNNFEDVTFFYEFSKVRSLNLYFEPTQSFDFTKFPYLEEVSLFYTKKFESIFLINDIEKLSIVNYRGKSFEAFTKLRKLKELVIRQSSVKNLDGIEYIKNIKTLEISHNRVIDNIEALKDNLTLKTITISSCPKLNNIELLGSIINLEVLVLENIKEMDNLNFLTKLTKLKSFRLVGKTNIIDGNLKWLLTKKNLTELFIPIKSHYDITIKDLK